MSNCDTGTLHGLLVDNGVVDEFAVADNSGAGQEANSGTSIGRDGNPSNDSLLGGIDGIWLYIAAGCGVAVFAAVVAGLLVARRRKSGETRVYAIDRGTISPARRAV